MPTTTPVDQLTPKQRQVYEMLAEGLAVPAIAKRMKVSPSGIYGHMRKIRLAGVALPNEQLASNGDAASNGASDDRIAHIIRQEIRKLEQRISASDREIQEHEAKVAELRSMETAARTQAKRYASALEQLID